MVKLSLFYTKHVTVKLLPFDNKSELSVVIDLPPSIEGRELHTAGGARRAVSSRSTSLVSRS